MRSNRSGSAALAAIVALTLATVPSGAAQAEAAIDVAILTVGQTWASLPADLEITVANPGTEPLETVTLTPAERLVPETLSGPTVIIGNDDNVLDPGERWMYQAQSEVPGTARIDVTASTPNAQTVSDSASIGTSPNRPIESTITTSTATAEAGEGVEWVVDVTNVTTFVLDYRGATGALWAGPPLMAGSSPITDPSPMTLLDRGEDGNDSWDPGETWRWSYEAVVTAEGSIFMLATVTFDNWRGGTSSWQEASDPIQVAPGPSTTVTQPTTTTTTTPSDQLPETGASTAATGLAALGAVLLGALLVLTTRRSVITPPGG